MIVQKLLFSCSCAIANIWWDKTTTTTQHGRHMEDYFFPLCEREESFVDGEGVIVLLMDFLCTMTDMLESECKVYSFWSATSSSHNSLKKIHFSTFVRGAYSLTCIQMFPAVVSSHIHVVVVEYHLIWWSSNYVLVYRMLILIQSRPWSS